MRVRPRLPVWAQIVLAYAAGALLVAVVWVRVMHRRPEAPTPQLDDPLYRGTDLDRWGEHDARYPWCALHSPHTHTDQAGGPHLVDGIPAGPMVDLLDRLGTVLDLVDAPNVHAARFYADRLIGYGMPHTVVDQALQQWHAEHRATFLFRDNSTDPEGTDPL